MFKVLAIFTLLAAGAQAQIRVLNLGSQGLQGLNLQNLQGLQGLQGLNGQSGQVVLLLQQPQLAVQPQLQVAVQPQPQIVAVRQAAPRVTVAARAQPVNDDDNGPGMPYSFQYSTDDEDGTTTTRKESSDGNTVTGSYSYRNKEGLMRTVNYISDENGYRADVDTNEPGTAKDEINGDPADTRWTISPPPQNLQTQARAAPVIVRVQAQPQPQPIALRLQPQPVISQPQTRFVLVNADQLQGNNNLRLSSTTTTGTSGLGGNIVLLSGLNGLNGLNLNRRK